MAGWNELAVSAAAVAVGGFRAHCLSRCFSPDAPAGEGVGCFCLGRRDGGIPRRAAGCRGAHSRFVCVTTATGCGLGQALSGPT